MGLYVLFHSLEAAEGGRKTFYSVLGAQLHREPAPLAEVVSTLETVSEMEESL